LTFFKAELSHIVVHIAICSRRNDFSLGKYFGSVRVGLRLCEKFFGAKIFGPFQRDHGSVRVHSLQIRLAVRRAGRRPRLPFFRPVFSSFFREQFGGRSLGGCGCRGKENNPDQCRNSWYWRERSELEKSAH